MRRIGTKGGKVVHMECDNRAGEPICHLRGTYYIRTDGGPWNRRPCERCRQQQEFHLMLARVRTEGFISTRVVTDRGAPE